VKYYKGEMLYTLTHFIPLIGPFIMASINDKNFKTKNIITFNNFKKNEKLLFSNYPELEDIKYKLENDSYTISEYKTFIKDNNIEKTDLLLSVPPCAGLSNLSKDNNEDHNNWIFETIKFFIAQDSNVLCFENANELSANKGIKILNKIHEFFKENNLLDTYKINIVKTNSVYHNLPQKRLRTFIYVYKSDKHYILKNKNNKIIMLTDFLKRDKEFNKEINHVNFSCQKELEYLKLFNALNMNTEIFEYKPNTIKFFWKLVFYDKIIDENKVYDLANKFNFISIIEKFNHIKSKLKDDKCFWDDSIILNNRYAPALIHRNFSKIVHPKYNDRFLTIRETLDLMGYPEDFKISEKYNSRQKLNILCQSVPINTAKDAIYWAVELYNKNNESKNINDLFLLQNNIKNSLQTELFVLQSNKYEKYKE